MQSTNTLTIDNNLGEYLYQWCCSQLTQILAKKAQLSARVVIPPVGLKLEVNFKIDFEILCHHAIMPLCDYD